jgi:hypothetical protein
MMSRMVPKPFSLFSHSWILSRLRLSLRAVNESSKTPAVFLWATEDVSFGREGSQHHAQFRGPPRSNWKECDMPARRSTLAEALEASLLLFVVDASDPTYQSQLEAPYRSGRSPHWIKSKNATAPAVKREAEEDWSR